MKKEAVITEGCGVVESNGKIIWHVMTCDNCGTCVTLTREQRFDGTDWIVEDLMPCCESPDYWWFKHPNFHERNEQLSATGG